MDWVTFLFFFIIFLVAGLFIAYNIMLIKAQNRAKNETKRSNKNKRNDYVFTVKKDYNKVDAYPSTFIVFDLETTGLSPMTEQIIEIGAIKYVNGIEDSRFHTYVNPKRHIPESASKVNHIYDKTVKKSPTINIALKEFFEFIGDNFLVAHNSDFDMSFIQTQANNLHLGTLSNKVIDTLELAKFYFRDLPNQKLVTIKNYLNIDGGSHNALDDCYVTARLYLHCRNESGYQYGVRSWIETNLNEEEEKYLNAIVKIFENNGFDKTELYIYQSGNYLVINGNDNQIKLKLSGKLKYMLLHVPTSKVYAKVYTNLKITEGNKNEGDSNSTRIFIESPEQLSIFENLIIGK